MLTYEHYLLTIKKKASIFPALNVHEASGLKKKNVAVIGDWHNDMPLFEYGAYNIAVKNAVPELKRKADYVTNTTNEEDAVGEVLELVHNYKQKAAN
jgi:hydroxymethylpyrimidine pyrophosphatase-like HAD family hydrolase